MNSKNKPEGWDFDWPTRVKLLHAKDGTIPGGQKYGWAHIYCTREAYKEGWRPILPDGKMWTPNVETAPKETFDKVPEKEVERKDEPKKPVAVITRDQDGKVIDGDTEVPTKNVDDVIKEVESIDKKEDAGELGLDTLSRKELYQKAKEIAAEKEIDCPKYIGTDSDGFIDFINKNS